MKIVCLILRISFLENRSMRKQKSHKIDSCYLSYYDYRGIEEWLSNIIPLWSLH